MIKVGVLGCGTVGSVLVKRLINDRRAIFDRTGIDFEVRAVAVNDLAKPRDVTIPKQLLTDNAFEVVSSPDIDVIVEVMGGIDPTRKLVLEALSNGKPVVTANKALLATHGPEIFDAASAAGLEVLFEAAVGGVVPIIRPLRESLAGERLSRVMGIVNGTTNFILTQMQENSVSYLSALTDAQNRGFAETDPTADVEGYDPAAKAAILAMIGFGAKAVTDDVYRKGIADIPESDFETSRSLGYVIKLVANVQRVKNGVALSVLPTLVSKSHPLASVRNSFNAVFIEGESAGELMLYGRGAGGDPTASAVLGDLIDAAYNLNVSGQGRSFQLEDLPIVSIDECESKFMLEMSVEDRPGVLAEVASVFGRNSVSIRSMEQQGLEEHARLVFMTHYANERSMRLTIEALELSEVVHHINSFYRVLDSNN